MAVCARIQHRRRPRPRLDRASSSNYNVVMRGIHSNRTRLVRIGNSRGVRIPKPLIEQAGLGDDVAVAVTNGAVIIRSCRRPREGWAAAFAAMARHGDDQLLDGSRQASGRFDRAEWRWR